MDLKKKVNREQMVEETGIPRWIWWTIPLEKEVPRSWFLAKMMRESFSVAFLRKAIDVYGADGIREMLESERERIGRKMHPFVSEVFEKIEKGEKFENEEALYCEPEEWVLEKMRRKKEGSPKGRD